MQASGSARILHHGFFDLYRPEVRMSDLGLLIASSIYDDLLTPRQGRFKGPRFDFQSDCELRLIQKTGVDAGRPSRGGTARYASAPIGTVSIPGGLSRDEICASIALTFNAGWQRLADEAYVDPSQASSGTGGVVYNHYGWHFAWVVSFESNFRRVTGPVVFLAYQGEQINEFATLHQGLGQDGRIVNYYRRYAFLSTPQGTWLIEKGAFPLDSPIRLPEYDSWKAWNGNARGGELSANVLVWSWHLPDEGIQVSGGVPYDSSSWPSRYWHDELARQVQTAHTNCSIYCSACGRDYRPDITVRELEVFASRGDLLDVCEYCFYCAACHRWSTPAERDRAFTWRERCEHTKRRGARSAFGHYIPDRDLALAEHPSPQAVTRTGQPMVGFRAMHKRRQAGSIAAQPGLLAASTQAATGGSIPTRPATEASSDEQIARMGLFASLAEQPRLKRDQAAKSLEVFWAQVERTPAGCWRWRGERPKTTLHHGDSLHSSTRRVEASKLAWALGTGQLLPTHSRVLPTCETADCINPAHKIEFVWLSDVWFWLRPSNQVGEDDWQEIAYSFKQRVAEESVPALKPREGNIAVRRAEFDAWLRDEGSQLISAFSAKYQLARATGASRAKDSRQPQDGANRSAGQDEAWWNRLGFSMEQAEKQVRLFQEMARLSGEEGTSLDQPTAQRNLARFYSRITLSQGGCWRWTKREPMFRLYKYGPWVDPRELAWWLSTGTRYRGLETRIASHNGRSWCLNPAHSDVEFTTVSAALFLPQIVDTQLTKALKELHPLDDPVQELRHRIHQAIEHRELPYRIDERTLGLKLWRSDVLSWWEAQRQESGDRDVRAPGGERE